MAKKSLLERLNEKYGAGASPLVRNKGASNQYGSTVYSRPKPAPSKKKTSSKTKASSPSKKKKVYSGRGSAGMPKQYSGRSDTGMPLSASVKTGPSKRPNNRPKRTGPSVMSTGPKQPQHRPSFSITAPESKTTASKTIRHTPRRPRAGWHLGGSKPKRPLVGQQFKTPR